MWTWRSSLRSSTIVLASLTAFCLGGHFAATSLIDTQKTRQLDELTEVVLRRSEVAVDFAASSTNEIAKSGHIGCDPASLQIYRLHVYQLPTVKDIRLARSDG